MGQRRHFLRACAAAAACLAGGSAAAAPSPEPRVAAALVTGKTNAFRTAQGLGALATSPDLTDAAQRFAEFMAATEQYGHEADGRKPADRARAQGYDYCVIAENIAFRFSSSGFTAEQLASELVAGWEQSPRHRHNMLLPTVVDLGVGIARSASQRWYAVQMFGRPQSAASRFEIVNGTDREVPYELDGRAYTLPPRVTRAHRGCFSGVLAMHGAGEGIAPREGARYVVQHDAAGQLRLQVSTP